MFLFPLLQMENDSKIKKSLPSRGQIQFIAKKTWSEERAKSMTI